MCHNGPWFCFLELTGKEWRMFKILINSFILNNLEPLMQKTQKLWEFVVKYMLQNDQNFKILFFFDSFYALNSREEVGAIIGDILVFCNPKDLDCFSVLSFLRCVHAFFGFFTSVRIQIMVVILVTLKY